MYTHTYALKSQPFLSPRFDVNLKILLLKSTSEWFNRLHVLCFALVFYSFDFNFYFSCRYIFGRSISSCASNVYIDIIEIRNQIHIVLLDVTELKIWCMVQISSTSTILSAVPTEANLKHSLLFNNFYKKIIRHIFIYFILYIHKQTFLIGS